MRYSYRNAKSDRILELVKVKQSYSQTRNPTKPSGKMDQSLLKVHMATEFIFSE
jgi:hypothetical protein